MLLYNDCSVLYTPTQLIYLFTGRGSFGRIYLASDDVDNEVTKFNARYVVKIEPHTNGPLFVEIHCLIRTAQAAKGKF